MGRLGKLAVVTAIAGAASLAGVGPSVVLEVRAAPSAPFTPAAGRLLDTRAEATTVDGRFAGIGRLEAGATTTVQIAGRGGVPADAVAVAVTVTVVDPLAPGFVTVFPCGPVPNVSTVNVAAGQIIAGSTVAMLDGEGRLCVYSMVSTHVVIDVTGTLGEGYLPVAPGRILDSRPGFATGDGGSQAMGLLAAGSVTEVQVSGRLGVPDGSTAAALTATVTGSSSDGYLSVYPCGPQPLASTVNHRARATVSNSSIVPLDASGKVCVFTLRAAHVVIDVVGYLSQGSTYAPVVPARVMDTRFDGVSIDHVCEATGRVASGTAASVPIAGRAGVPVSGVGAVVLNVTTLGAKRPGFVTAFVPGTTMPVASTVNFVPQDLVTNSVIAPVDDAGRVALFVNTGSHLVVDVVGWFPGTATAAPGATCTGTFVDPRQTRQLAVDTSSQSGCALTGASDIRCWTIGGLVRVIIPFDLRFPISGSLVEIAGASGQVCGLRTDGSVACSYPQFGVYEIPLTDRVVDIVGFGFDVGFCAIDVGGGLSCWTPMAPPSPEDITRVVTSGRAIGFVPLSYQSGPIGVITGSGTADVIVRQQDNRFAVAWTSREAVPGRPWSTVVQAHAAPSGEMCLVLVDGSATCGSSGDVAPDLDVEWNDGVWVRDATGSVRSIQQAEGGGASAVPVSSGSMVRLADPFTDLACVSVIRADGWCFLRSG